jgi:hypothetical protein
MMYRVVNQLIDIPSQILVHTISPRGNNITFLVPYARTIIYQKSFFPDGKIPKYQDWSLNIPMMEAHA